MVPEILNFIPPFIQLELIDDDAFRKQIGIRLEGTITLDRGAVNIPRSAFFSAIRALYDSPERRGEIRDEDGETWELVGVKEEELDTISVSAGDRRYRIHGFAGLNPNREARLAQFRLALKEAGLAPGALPEWHAILEERPLDDEEVRRLDQTLALTPGAVMRRLEEELNGPTGNLETLVPPHRIYFERLVGAGEATNITAYAEELAPVVVADLLAWDEARGAQMALLLSSHASIIPETGLADLSEQTLTSLAAWAVRSGDLLSKVGAIETGLAALPRIPALAGPVQQIVRQILDLEPEDESGPLQLMMATFVLVDAELSRLKLLDDWPPFRRRIAALAQAGLLQRLLLGRIDVGHFANWALQQGGQRFYLQTLADLRLEPRWLPDMASTEQLKAELVGRVHNAAGRFADNVADGPLRELLFSDDPSALPRQMTFPASLLPGPIEASPATPGSPIPPAVEEILDRALASDTLRPENVLAMINTRGLFQIGHEKVDRAVKLIRNARHRFPSGLENEKRDALLAGLAAVACTTRSGDLAGDVRLMMRRVRVDRDNPLTPDRELLVAAIAAGAYGELGEWTAFFGTWATELAFAVDAHEEAAALHSELEALCIIVPTLRQTAGRALAALQAYVSA